MTPTSPTLALAPGTHAPGAGANTGADTPLTAATAFRRASQPGYFDWLDHIWTAAGCTHPVRLHGELRTVDATTGEIVRTISTDDLPDRVIYKACGNRRTAACPSCAETYRRDAYHVIRAGLIGGKGVTETVGGHPAVFATFTAPSFGPVHSRVIKRHTCRTRERCSCRPEPCHARRDLTVCEHGQPSVCFARHFPGDDKVGQPLCPDCYDYAAHVVWNNATGELWRRTKQGIERYLAHQARLRGIPFARVLTQDGKKYRTIPPVRVAHGKAAEFQVRGAVHFHVLIRLDGVDPDDLDLLIPPPAGITVADLDDAIRYAATHIRYTSPEHVCEPSGWHIGWGQEIDIRVITMSGTNSVTDAMVAAYLAKYSTKGTEATGHTSRRLDADTIDIHADPAGNHAERLIDACWTLGRDRNYHGLRRWAHMLGFGGHFLTKGRRYSITFRILRDARLIYRRSQTTGPEHQPIRTADHTDDDTTLIIGNLRYVGTGWKTTGDALLANTAADLARRRREAMREDLAHESVMDFGQDETQAA